MNAKREAFLQRLKAFAEDNDRTVFTRDQKMLNITADTGWMVWMLIRAWAPSRILEVGTSNGYSTIWWADAMQDPTQMLVTLEFNPEKVREAAHNFGEAGVADRIQIVQGDAGVFLRTSEPSTWDLIFLDAVRIEYVGYWPNLIRILAPNGLIIVDNAVDKAVEIAFREAVAKTPGFRQVLVPIGNGELFIQPDTV